MSKIVSITSHIQEKQAHKDWKELKDWWAHNITDLDEYICEPDCDTELLKGIGLLSTAYDT